MLNVVQCTLQQAVIFIKKQLLDLSFIALQSSIHLLYGTCIWLAHVHAKQSHMALAIGAMFNATVFTAACLRYILMFLILRLRGFRKTWNGFFRFQTQKVLAMWWLVLLASLLYNSLYPFHLFLGSSNLLDWPLVCIKQVISSQRAIVTSHEIFFFSFQCSLHFQIYSYCIIIWPVHIGCNDSF